jgi:serine/threonine protein kinase
MPGPFVVDRLIQDSAHWRVVAAHYSDSVYTGGQKKSVCIKIFRKKVARQRRKEGVLANEILAYKQLQRSEDPVGKMFVMNLHGALQDDKRLYYVMDLMCGDLLHVILRYSPEEIRRNAPRWIAQTARGLQCIHDSGVIHRDLKPENILIDKQNNIKIVDFGCSYVHPYGQPIMAKKGYSSTVTGTPCYMAPEVWRNADREARPSSRSVPERYGSAVDWWALGCIVWDLENEADCSLFESSGQQEWYASICQLYGDLDPVHLEFGSLTSDAESLILGVRCPFPRWGCSSCLCNWNSFRIRCV